MSTHAVTTSTTTVSRGDDEDHRRERQRVHRHQRQTTDCRVDGVTVLARRRPHWRSPGHAADGAHGKPGREPLAVRRGMLVRLEDAFGLDLDGDLLADEHAAAFEHLVPGEPEVFAVDLGVAP